MNASAAAAHDSDLPAHILARTPYAAHLGILREQDGFLLPYRERLLGDASRPALHGGVVAGFMETAALLHLLLNDIAATRLPKTIDFSIDYLRSAGPRATHAACEVQRVGRRVALVSVRCWQEDTQKPVALARAHFLWEARDQGEGAAAGQHGQQG
ncbi:MAG: PaaI family thioesterase [Nevskiales bacterium]